MQYRFQQEIESLKHLSPDDLYLEFHKIQFSVLRPQLETHFKSLIEQVSPKNVLELTGPRTPEIPKTYTLDILDQISQASKKEILFLNHVLSFMDNPIKAFQLAKDSGIKTVVVHESPKDGTFKYESYPEVKFFVERNQLSFQKREQSAGNDFLDHVVRTVDFFGWEKVIDNRLVFEYLTEKQKLSLVKMELCLDLIEYKFGGSSSLFDQIKSELKTWFFYPGSCLKVKGCSRWMLFIKSF